MLSLQKNGSLVMAVIIAIVTLVHQHHHDAVINVLIVADVDALEGQTLPRMYLACHELDSITTIIIVMLICRMLCYTCMPQCFKTLS